MLRYTHHLPWDTHSGTHHSHMLPQYQIYSTQLMQQQKDEGRDWLQLRRSAHIDVDLPTGQSRDTETKRTTPQLEGSQISVFLGSVWGGAALPLGWANHFGIGNEVIYLNRFTPHWRKDCFIFKRHSLSFWGRIFLLILKEEDRKDMWIMNVNHFNHSGSSILA